MSEIVSTEFSDIPRYKASNPFNYDNLTIAHRKKEIEAAIKDYPNVPSHTIEMAWDLIQNNPKEEMDEIINTGRWEKAPKKERALGGTLKNIVIES